MGFTWTQTIGQFTEKIEAQDVQELRNNVDWLNNNLECQTHHTYCSGHYTSHLSTYYTPNYASQCGTYCASVNISYQPYVPCDSLGTCFPAGVKVLMYNGRWFSIEDIIPGDVVMSFYGKPNKILDIYNTTLGRNRVMLGFLDDSLFLLQKNLIGREMRKKNIGQFQIIINFWLKKILIIILIMSYIKDMD